MTGRAEGSQAAVVVAHCQASTARFGIRMEDDGTGTWWSTWAFEITAERAAREGYSDTTLSGSYRQSPGYPGCPACGNATFAGCGVCRAITCYSGSGSWTCSACRITGIPSGPLRGDISANSD